MLVAQPWCPGRVKCRRLFWFARWPTAAYLPSLSEATVGSVSPAASPRFGPFSNPTGKPAARAKQCHVMHTHGWRDVTTPRGFRHVQTRQRLFPTPQQRPNTKDTRVSALLSLIQCSITKVCMSLVTKHIAVN